MNFTEIGLILDTQSMFSDLLVLIANEFVLHFNYSSFPGSNFYCFKISLYMLYLKEHLKMGSTIVCISRENSHFSRKLCLKVNT